MYTEQVNLGEAQAVTKIKQEVTDGELEERRGERQR